MFGKLQWGIGFAILTAIAATIQASESPADLLERARAKYASLQSYSDTGVINAEMNGGSPVLLKERHTFTTYFRAPKQFLFDFKADPRASGDRFVLWIDGAEVNTWWKATGVHDVYPVGQGATGFAIATLPTKESVGLIAPALLPGLNGVLTELQEPRLLKPESVNGHRCFKIAGDVAPAYSTGRVTATNPVTLWIDAETLLIRKVFTDTAREQSPSVIDRSTVTIEPLANPKVPPAIFKFSIPR